MYHSDGVITAVYFANQTEKLSVTCTCVPTILSVHDIVSTLPITIIVEQNVHQLKLSERFGLALLSSRCCIQSI